MPKKIGNIEELNKLLDPEVGCNHFDADFRMMADRMIWNYYKKSENVIDQNYEDAICKALTTHLGDNSLEVKSTAVQVIEEISPKIRNNSLFSIMESLCQTMVSCPEEEVAIYSMTLRSLVKRANEQQSEQVVRKVYKNLILGLAKKENQRVKEILDTFSEMLKKYGQFIKSNNDLLDKNKLMDAINEQMMRGSTDEVKSRASLCMGSFAVILDQNQLKKLTNQIFATLNANKNKQEMVISANTLSFIISAVQNRFSVFVDEFVSVLAQRMGNLVKDKCVDLDNDLSSSCLNAIENIIMFCPTQAIKHSDMLLPTCINLMKYDPEYNYIDTVVDVNMGEDDDEGWGYDSEDDGMNNEVEDSAWKVRRGAIKVIDNIALSSKEYLLKITQKYSIEIAERLKERHDTCKLEIFEALKTLFINHNSGDSTEQLKKEIVTPMTQQILVYICKNADHKNLKVKIATISTISALASTLTEGLDAHIDKVIPILKTSVEDKDNHEPTLECLQILGVLFKSCKHGTGRQFVKYAKELTDFLLHTLEHSYPRVIGKGLSVTGQFLCMMHTGYTFQKDFSHTVPVFFAAIVKKLNDHTLDSEIRKLCVFAAADLISVCHQALSDDQKSEVMKILIGMLGNDLLIESVLKSITLIALHETTDLRARRVSDNISHQSNQTMSSLVPLLRANSSNPGPKSSSKPGLQKQTSVVQALEQIVGLKDLTIYLPKILHTLQKSNIQVQQNGLECLEALTRRYANQFAAKTTDINNAIAKLINDDELSTTDLAFKVAFNLVKINPKSNDHNVVIEALIHSVSRDFIQGEALQSLSDYMKVLAENGLLTQPMLNKLTNSVSLNAQVPALCLAICATSNQQYASLKTQFAQSLNDKGSKYQVVGALCIGELGRRTDLSKDLANYKRIQQLINSDQEEVRSAASTGLGKMSLGNTGFFLGDVIKMINSADQKFKVQYLNAIREIILNNVKALDSEKETLVDALFEMAKLNQEKIRNMVAECLGRLFSEYSFEIVEDFVNMITTGSTQQKQTVAKSFQYSGRSIKNDDMHTDAYKEAAQALCLLAKADDCECKKNVIEGLTAIIKTNFSIVSDLKKQILDRAFTELTINPKFLKETPMPDGSVQKIDQGASLRIASYTLLKNLFELGVANTDEVNLIIDQCMKVTGLKDKMGQVERDDVLTHALTVLAFITNVDSLRVVAKLDAFVPVMEERLKVWKGMLANETVQAKVFALLKVAYRLESSNELMENSHDGFSNFVKTGIYAQAAIATMYDQTKQQLKSEF